MTLKATRFVGVVSISLAMTLGANAQLSGPGGGFRKAAPAQPKGASHQPSQGNRNLPPTPPATDAPGLAIFLDYAVIVLLGGAVVAVSLIPGKRGHQD